MGWGDDFKKLIGLGFPTALAMAMKGLDIQKNTMARQANQGKGLDESLGSYSEEWADVRQDRGRNTDTKTLMFTGAMMKSMQVRPENDKANLIFVGSTTSDQYMKKEEKKDYTKAKRQTRSLYSKAAASRVKGLYSGKLSDELKGERKSLVKDARARAKREADADINQAHKVRSVSNTEKALNTNAQTPWIGLGPVSVQEAAEELARWVAKKINEK